MTRDAVVAYAASALASFIFAVILAFMGAPLWATYGLSYLAFGLYRAEDRRKAEGKRK